jgi:uncharacterized protein (DUF2267 family)
MSGIVPVVVVTLPRNLYPVISMQPGPKNKGGCPSDLHLKLPDDVRYLIDELGPGRYQDKIIESIRRCSRKKPSKSVTELQMEIFEIRKEIKVRHEKLESLKDDLQEQVSPEKFEEIEKRINEDIDNWWQAIT